jgi:hypothetical protein
MPLIPSDPEQQKRLAQQWNWAAAQTGLRSQKRKNGPGVSKASYVIVLGVFAVAILLLILMQS